MSSAFVNKHINRILEDGGNEDTINIPFLNRMDDMLDTVGVRNNLEIFTHPAFGVKNSGSLLRVYDLGTTRLPRSKDFNATTTNTSYNSAGLTNGGPTWTNSTNTAYGYWGDPISGNTIRRHRQITIIAAYERSQTTEDVCFIGTGPIWGNTNDGNKIIALRHTLGTPGTIEFSLCDATSKKTATVAATGSALQFASGTYDGTQMIARSLTTPGTAVTTLDPNPNFGQQANQSGNNTCLIEGSLSGGRMNQSGSGPDVAPGLFPKILPFLANGSIHAYRLHRYGAASSTNFTETQAKVKMHALLIFDVALSSSQIASVITELDSSEDW